MPPVLVVATGRGAYAGGRQAGREGIDIYEVLLPLQPGTPGRCPTHNMARSTEGGGLPHIPNFN